MNPAAERIVERDIVFGDQRAAGGGGTEGAKADSLRGRIGDERAGAAKQLDAGELAELIVECDAGGRAQRLGGEQAGGDWAFQSAERGAIGGDGDLFGLGERRRIGWWGSLGRGGCGRRLRRGLSGEVRRDRRRGDRRCNKQGERASDRFEFEQPHGLESQESGTGYTSIVMQRGGFLGGDAPACGRERWIAMCLRCC